MPDKGYKTIRFLEIAKWCSLKIDAKLIHKNTVDTWKFHYCDDIIQSPEGFLFSFYKMVMNYSQAKASDGKQHSFALAFKMSGDNEDDEDKITPTISYHPNSSNVEVMLFASEYLKSDHYNWIRDDFYQKFSTTGLNSGYMADDFGYVPYSLVIIDLGINNDFTTFRNMNYSSWKNHLDQAISDAKNGSFSNLLKYDPDILMEELSIDDRKEIIQYIINEESWSWWDFDGFDEGVCILELFSFVSDADGIELFDWLLDNNNSRFKKLHDLMKNTSSFVPFILILVRHYYSEDHDNNYSNISNILVNTHLDHIVPVCWETVGESNFFQVGAVIGHQFIGNNRISFNITLKKFDETRTGPYQQLTEPWIFNLDNTGEPISYDLFETIGVIPTLDRIEQGFIKLKVYPVPAFAVPAIHQMLSEDFSWTEKISMFFEIASIAIPFFKLVSYGTTFAETIGLIYAVVAADVGKLKPYLEQTEAGRTFLTYFNFVNTIWNFKDGISVLTRATELYRKYGKIVLRDFDDLSFSWTVYQETTDYINNISHDDDLKRLNREMERFQEDLAKIKNSIE